MNAASASRSLEPSELAWALRSGTTLALIDVRAESTYSARHLIHASSFPRRNLELTLPSRVPLHCTVIVCDESDAGEAREAAVALLAWGYRDVRVLAGGVQAWENAGLPVYGGMHTYSKAFGEFVESTCGTPHVSAPELSGMLEGSRPPIVIDCRPRDEYLRGSLSVSRNLPGIELLYRLGSLVKDTSTPIVVHCAGRTRSIIGAQTLVDAGVKNPVAALENGTMGWLLAGMPVVTREHAGPVPVAASSVVELAGHCRALATEFGIAEVGRDQVDALLRSDEAVTLVLDVRTDEEFTAGHHPAAIHAPGGQLLQATDRFAAVHGATLVLADDDGLRATLTAAWLRRMGWSQVLVFPMRSVRGAMATGPAPRHYFRAGSRHVDMVDAVDLRGLIEAGAALVYDLDTSIEYARGHIPEAWFVKRSSLQAQLARPRDGKIAVLSCSDGTLSRIVAETLPGNLAASVLRNGKRAWRAAGYALESGRGASIDAHDDVWRRPLDDPDDVEASMRQYLTWEVGLLDKIRHDPTVAFREPGASAKGDK